MNCQRQGCEKEATCSLAINIPATGCPIAEHDPIRVVIGLQLCDEHLAETKAGDFFTSDGRLEKIVRIRSRGLAEPDFKRAFVSRVEFDSEEWRALSKNRSA